MVSKRAIVLSPGGGRGIAGECFSGSRFTVFLKCNLVLYTQIIPRGVTAYGPNLAPRWLYLVIEVAGMQRRFFWRTTMEGSASQRPGHWFASLREHFIQSSACPKSWMMDIRSMMGRKQNAAVNAQQSEY